jgi:hypothetical protein
LYIGAVAVLPTYAPLVAVLIERSTSPILLLVRLLEESKSGKQALREVRMKDLFCGDSPGLTERVAVWGDGFRGGLHVLGGVSVMPVVLVPYVSFD